MHEEKLINLTILKLKCSVHQRHQKHIQYISKSKDFVTDKRSACVCVCVTQQMYIFYIPTSNNKFEISVKYMKPI